MVEIEAPSRRVAPRFPRSASRRSWAARSWVAAVVGTLLVAINYSDRALAGALGPADWVKMILTYFVPYGVATYAAVDAIRQAT